MSLYDSDPGGDSTNSNATTAENFAILELVAESVLAETRPECSTRVIYETIEGFAAMGMYQFSGEAPAETFASILIADDDIDDNVLQLTYARDDSLHDFRTCDRERVPACMQS